MADPGYIVDGVLADGEAWVGLNTATLGSDTATITFKSGFADGDDLAGSGSGGVQNWDQYMDLVLICYAQTATTGTSYSYLDTYLNNDTTVGNYARQRLEGDGGSVTVDVSTAFRIPVANVNLGANVFGAAVVHFFDINSGKYKSALFSAAADGDGSGHMKTAAVTWKNQAAITEIDLVGWQGTYDIKAGSMLSLFGVLPRMVA